MTMDGATYGVPYYSHAQVMWYRTDLLEANNLEVPKTWDEFYDAAVALTKDGVYGCGFSCSPNDLLCTVTSTTTSVPAWRQPPQRRSDCQPHQRPGY